MFRRPFLLPLALIALGFVLVGCGGGDEVKVEKIAVFSGGDQCAFPHEVFAKELYIRTEGENSAPLAYQKLRISVEKGSDLIVSSNEAETDAGGIARIRVTAGGRTGDNYLNVFSAADPEISRKVRFVVGVKLLGANQEGHSGTTLPHRVGVKVVDSAGKPLSGVPVFFTPQNGVRVENGELRTDSDGEALVEVRLPDATAAGRVNVEVSGRVTDNPIRPLTAGAMSVNLYLLIVNVLGGLAIFVLGMKMMSEGLSKAAGDRMRNILHFCSRNRVVAVAIGALVTAAVQSSSATTVMVIGFVNAGLLNLTQSIGIIFGANIGTTITAQIVAFDVSEIAMPCVIVGLLLLFVTWQWMRGWGETILGFGLLFFGMNLMSGELGIISGFTSFSDFFRSFDCAPLNGSIPVPELMGAIGIGLLGTMLLQSSSAATGVVIALGASGLVNLYTAVALILGSNIGTTITAQLAAIPTNRVAKQAALAHTLFNVLGVLLISSTFWINWKNTGIPVFFYLVNSITGGNVFAEIPENMPRHIANAHTLFNVITTVILLPFVGVFAAVCSKLIPVGERRVKYQYLEPHLLESPTLAIEQAVIALRRMLSKSWGLVDAAVNRHFLPVSLEQDDIELLKQREKKIDRYQLEIMEYLSQIMKHGLSRAQAGQIPPLMHCTNDSERIADRAGNILQLTERMRESNAKLTPDAASDLTKMFNVLEKQAHDTLLLLERTNEPLAASTVATEEIITEMSEEFESAHIERLNHGRCAAATGIIYVELLAELVAISRHIANIAERNSTIHGDARPV